MPSKKHKTAAFFGVALRLHPSQLAAQPLNLSLLGLHHPMPRKRRPQVRRLLPHPFAQHLLVQVQIACGLRHR